MTTEAKKILDKLDTISSDIEYIKKRVVDVDMVLTDDDIQAIREAKEEYKTKKTKRI